MQPRNRTGVGLDDAVGPPGNLLLIPRQRGASHKPIEHDGLSGIRSDGQADATEGDARIGPGNEA